MDDGGQGRHEDGRMGGGTKCCQFFLVELLPQNQNAVNTLTFQVRAAALLG